MDNGNGNDNLRPTDTTVEGETNEAESGNQTEVVIPIVLQESKSKPSDRRFATPERAPATRRNVEDAGQAPHPKPRRLSEEVMDMGDGNGDALTAMGVD